MKPSATLPVLGLLTGLLLAVMIHLNSQLAAASSPLAASFIAHGTGLASAVLLMSLAARQQPTASTSAPLWSFAGGLPGAFTVVLAAITVNSPLALSGTLALVLAGQLLFGLACDRFGWFGMPQRRLDRYDALRLALVASGIALMLFTR